MSRHIATITKWVAFTLSASCLTFIGTGSLTSVATADAPATVTKTITVLDHSNNPLAGASVYIGYDSATAANAWATSSIVTTDGSGHASVTVPASPTVYAELEVEPAASDTVDAVGFIQNYSLAASGSTTVNLKAANFHVHMGYSDGTELPLFSNLGFPTDSITDNGASGDPFYFNILRTGSFGISLPQDLSGGDFNYFFEVVPWTYTNTAEMLGHYDIRVSGSVGNESYAAFVSPAFYSNPDQYSVQATVTNGVNQLLLRHESLNGRISNPDGSHYTRNNNQDAQVTLNPLNQDGTLGGDFGINSWIINSGRWGLSPNGSGYGNTTINQGAYKIFYGLSGSATSPAFIGNTFYVDSNQKFSSTANGTFTTDFTLNEQAPAPTFVYSALQPGNSNTPINGNINISEVEGNNTVYVGGVALQGQNASLALPDGDWQLQVEPGSGFASSMYTLHMASGTPTLKDENGNSVSATNGVFALRADTSNFTFQVLSPTDQSPLQQIGANACPSNGPGNCYDGGVGQDGIGHMHVPDGNYTLRIYPNGYPEFATKAYSVTFTGGVLTTISPSVTPVNGLYSLTLDVPNFAFSVSAPDSPSPMSNVYVDACPNNGPGECIGTGQFTNGIAKLKVPDGNWTIRTHPNNSQYAEKDYNVTFSGGSLTSISPSISPTNGVYPLMVATSNFYVKIVSPIDTSSAVSNSWLEWCPDLGGGQFQTCNGTGTNNGLASASLANGDWVIRVHPGDGSSFAMATYSVAVSGGTAHLNNSSITAVNGTYSLPLAVPNLSGTIKDPSGGTITFGNGVGVNVNLQQQDGNGNWNYVGQGAWAQGTFALNATTPGSNYRLIFEPQGLPQFASTVSATFTINNDHSVTVAGGGSATSMAIRLTTPNYKFEVHNPLDNSLLPFGWISIQKLIVPSDISKGTQWVGNANLNPSTPGLTAANLPDGTYQFTVNPPNGNQSIPGLAAYAYTGTVSGGTVTLLDGTTPLVTNQSGAYVVSPASANITGRVVDSTGSGIGSGAGVWVNISVQQLINGANWNWMSLNAQTDSDGYFGIYLKDPGTYRLRIQPQGRTGVSTTYSDNFTITSASATTFKQDFGSITDPAPNLQVKVVQPGSSTADQNVNVDIQSNNQWVDNIWIDNSGLGASNLTTAGTYQLTVHPTAADVTAGFAQKTYVATVTNNSGVYAVSVAGLTPSNGVYTLALGSATVKGQVLAPTDTTPVWNSQVVAVDQSTGQELWQFSTGTDINGNWSMALPAGTYKLYARAPGGNATMADSAKTSTFTVDNTGTVTSGSSTAVIHLTNPTWSGVLKNPDSSTVISNASVCLNYLFSGTQYGSCVGTDALGRWAFAAPTGFTSFDATAQLRANENVSPQYGAVVLGQSALNSKLGTGVSGLVLNLQVPNVTVHVGTVENANTGVPNVWINLDRDNYGWLSASGTDQSGNAHFYIPDLTKNINVQVDVNGNPTIGATYSGIRQAFSDSYISAHATGSPKTITLNVNLPHPNITGIVRDPATGNPAPFTWVDLFDSSSNTWMGGQGTNQDGYFSLNAPAPSSGTERYVLGVNPSGQSSSLSARKTYSVSVGTDNSVTIKNDATGSAPNTEIYNGSNVNTFLLAAPTVAGIVNDNTGAAEPYAYVQPYDIVLNQWINGQGVLQTGRFGLALNDGQYRLQANPNNMATGQAPSAYCNVTVASGAITTGGSCVQSDKSVVLQLRSPNFNITVHDSSGTALAGANVGVCVASWCSNAQTNASGVASLFIDKDAILASSSGLTSASPNQNIYLWIDPPYGSSAVVRTQCSSGQVNTQCASLPKVSMSAAFGNYSQTISMPGPNVRATIHTPIGGTLGANYWATLYSVDVHGNRQWLGNGPTDSSGGVAFLVDTSTVTRVALEVDVPNNSSQNYANTIWDSNTAGYDPSTLNSQTFWLATPNLQISASAYNSITGSSDTNTYGGVLVEKYDTVTSRPIAWVSSFGLNDQGQASVNLGASTTFRITVFPGPNKSGAGTTCVVRTSSGASPTVSAVAGLCATGTISAGVLSMSLSHGNIFGVVKNPTGGVVAGAIVSATGQLGSDTSTAVTVVSSTDANGTYGLQLDQAKTWTLSVIPFNDSNSSTQLAVYSATIPSSAFNQTMPDIRLSKK